jgi:N-acetylmuramoyl-L-alanine amidase
MVLATALMCLAMNIYHEARGEPIMGQYAVALVTLNRAEAHGTKVCTEVLKSKQFSWTEKLVHKRTVVKAGAPSDPDAWKKALIIARVSLAGRMPDFTHGAMFYHERRVHPKWRMAMEPTKSIGNHVFYRQIG